MQSGNTLVVWKLDRLGCSLKHLVSIVDDLNNREISFKVLAGTGAQIDTTTSNGRLVFVIFAALAEFEADLIRERTKSGLAAARSRGRPGERPRKMNKEKLLIAMAAMSDPKTSATAVAKELGITRSSLYDYVKGVGSLKEHVQKLLAD